MTFGSDFSGKTILVTGGSGAIGSHVIRQFPDAKEVIVVDNLSSGTLAYAPKADNLTLYVCDIRDGEKLDAIFRDHNVDVVIHLAAHFANQNSVEFPTVDLAVNVAGTLNLLQRCHAKDARFIYASSSCVYGQKTGPVTEDLPIDDLHTPYAISKYSGELYTKFYADHYGMSCVVLRFFNNFGPYEAPGRYRNVIPNFVARALRGEPMVITGTGEETRDFNYVENTAQAVRLATAQSLAANQMFDVFNVGTGQQTRILDLAEKIKALTGGTAPIDIKGARRDWDHTTSRCADVAAITNKLGYKPTVSLDEGLERTVSWLQSNPELWRAQ